MCSVFLHCLRIERPAQQWRPNRVRVFDKAQQYVAKILTTSATPQAGCDSYVCRRQSSGVPSSPPIEASATVTWTFSKFLDARRSPLATASLLNDAMEGLTEAPAEACLR